MHTFLAGTGSAAIYALFRFFNREDPEFMSSILVGGIVGAVCFVPSYFLIDTKKLPRRHVKPLLWTNIIAGAIAGLCLAIPVGIGTFLYVADVSKKHDDKP